MPSCRGLDSIKGVGQSWKDGSEESVKREIKTNFLNGMHDTGHQWPNDDDMALAWVRGKWKRIMGSLCTRYTVLRNIKKYGYINIKIKILKISHKYIHVAWNMCTE